LTLGKGLRAIKQATAAAGKSRLGTEPKDSKRSGIFEFETQRLPSAEFSSRNPGSNDSFRLPVIQP
jgi:hypothetical protein